MTDRRRALAYNALGRTLRDADHWLPFSTRRAAVDSVLAAVDAEDQAAARPHACGNCEGIDPSSCIANPNRATRRAALAGSCGCGAPATPDVVHRQGAPCYMDLDGSLQTVELPPAATRQTTGQADAEQRVAKLEAEIARLHDEHKASLRRADQVNAELMQEVQRYAGGTERPVLWSVYNQMHSRALTAEAKLGAPAVGQPDPAVVEQFIQHMATQPDPTTADDPTPLRWGLGDVIHGDDDSVIVCLSGSDREPYWLELDPDRRDALRDDLAPVETHVVTDDSDDPEHTDDCPGCDAGIEHTEHCPTPETHNWGCGCPTDAAPAVEQSAEILARAASDLCAFGHGEAAAFLRDRIKALMGPRAWVPQYGRPLTPEEQGAETLAAADTVEDER